MFAVVKTIEKNKIVFTTVSESWIDFKENMLFFPRPNDPIPWQKHRSKHSPPQSDWDIFSCVVKKSGFKTISDATDFEKTVCTYANTDDENA